jgi:hypothetical protein
MVDASVLARILDREQILHLLDDADGGVITACVGTDRTYVAIRQVITAMAVLHIVAETGDARRERIYDCWLHLEDVHRQAQCRAAADTWQALQLATYIIQ